MTEPREAVIDAAYRRHWPSLVRLGHLLTGSQALGEELAQEAFIGLLTAKHPVEAQAAYLRRSIVNLSINNGRKAQREREYVAQQAPQTAAAPELDELWPHIVRLPVRQRSVLVLRYYEDLAEAEIAAILGCRRGTVKSLAARALDQLRKELA